MPCGPAPGSDAARPIRVSPPAGEKGMMLMNRRAVLGVVLASSACVFLAGVLFAHPGGLDSRGGHFNRKTGEYHYHRRVDPAPQGPAGSSGAQGLLARPGETPSAAPVGGALHRYTTDQKVDALIAVLRARGVVTEEELSRALAGSR